MTSTTGKKLETLAAEKGLVIFDDDATRNKVIELNDQFAPSEDDLQKSLGLYTGSSLMTSNGMFSSQEKCAGQLIHGEPTFLKLQGNYRDDIEAFVTCFTTDIHYNDIPDYFHDSVIMENIRKTWAGFTGNVEEPSLIQDFFINRYTMPFKQLSYNDVIYLAMMHASLLDNKKLFFEFCDFSDMPAIFSKISNVIYILHAINNAIDYSEIDEKNDERRMYRVCNFEHAQCRLGGVVAPADYYNAYYTFFNDQLYLVASRYVSPGTQLKVKRVLMK
jgi:hypothetical protein